MNVLLSLPRANYTAIVSGVDRTTGIALAEAYNLDSNEPPAHTYR